LGQTATIDVGECFGGKTFEVSHTGMLYKGRLTVLEIFQDVTDRKQAEKTLRMVNEELRRLAQLKSDFVSHVSHELRTPLTAIKEGIGIVLDGTAGQTNPDQKELLEISKHNVDRLHRLINNVLDFSRIESGKMVLKIETHDIFEAIEHGVKTEKSVAESKGLFLKYNFAEGIPQIQFDHDRIEQVIINLLDNAIKFTQKGGITIAVYKDDNQKSVIVCVEDTGIGIRAEDQSKLFKSFSQLDGGADRKTGGSGLGLVISKDIIEQHRGRIWVESEIGKGLQGSRFCFSLPI
jgi:signal transduction histidine kinase